MTLHVDVVRQSRTALGLSQEEFARRLGVSFATVNRWERGHTRPRGAALARLGSLRAVVPPHAGVRAVPASLQALAPASSSFFGRGDELVALEQSARRARLVTVVGPVGSGKTRLVAEAARRGSLAGLGQLLAASLAPVTRDEDVAAYVGQQLSVDATDGPSAIVLDNCEHVRAGCAALVENLLAESGQLRVVATSREPLGIAGEAVLRLAPLESGGPASVAVELFVDRARMADPDYAPDEQETADIASLCRRLDGLPLAIELAAGCMPALRPAQMVVGLDRRFETLGAERLRAAIAASYELLAPREREVFEALSVFVQPFTLDAAETVAGGTDVLLVVARLAAKSLVETAADVEGIRYAMLESIRAFASDQLGGHATREPAMERLWAWSLRFAQGTERGMAGQEQANAMTRAGRDAENVAAAIDWAIGRADAARAVELAGTFWRYWYSRGDVARGRRLLTAALDLPGRVATAARARALFGAGILARHQADFGAAVDHLRAHLALAEQLDDERGMAEALNSLAGAYHGLGESRRAAGLLARSLDYWERSGDRRGLAAALSNLGVLASDAGDQARAREYGEQALAIRLALGHAESVAISYENLATAAVRAADAPAARQLFGETLRRYAELDEPDGVATALEGLAAVVNPALALILLTVADRTRQEMGVPRAAAADAFEQAVAARVSHELGERAATVAAEAERMTLAEATALAEAELANDPPLAPQGLLRRRLTRREREVLEQVAAGRTTKEIAAGLGLSSRTVDRHLANIYAKIGARGRADAIAFALRTAG